MAKVHDPRADSPRPAETSVELVSVLPVAAGDVQAVVDTTQTDALQLKGEGRECGFPLLLCEDKLLHVVITQQDEERLFH